MRKNDMTGVFGLAAAMKKPRTAEFAFGSLASMP
jgi:hypothetical protein